MTTKKSKDIKISQTRLLVLKTAIDFVLMDEDRTLGDGGSILGEGARRILKISLGILKKIQKNK